MTRSLRQKRPRSYDDSDAPNASEAANFNATVLRKVQRALKEDPEIGISSVLPSNYSSRLASKKIVEGEYRIALQLSVIN